jgi:hypothetical protein
VFVNPDTAAGGPDEDDLFLISQVLHFTRHFLGDWLDIG